MRNPDLILLDAALDGDRAATRALVERLAPVIQVRVARCLLRHADGSVRRNVREEVKDLTQEVLTGLFAEDARVLRSWDPGRGASLENFIGMVATRQAISLLRTRRHSPWADDPVEEIEALLPPVVGPELLVLDRDLLARVVARLEAELSPRGVELFQLLVLEGLAAGEVAEITGLSREAVYTWKSRLLRLVRLRGAEIVAEPPSRAEEG